MSRTVPFFGNFNFLVEIEDLDGFFQALDANADGELMSFETRRRLRLRGRARRKGGLGVASADGDASGDVPGDGGTACRATPGAPESRATAEFGGQEISAPVMYAFFENDRDPTDGFATDETGSTHNVVTRLPEQEGYSPLWALRVFKIDVFDRVNSVGSAQDNDREDNVIILPEVLIINAPIVEAGSPGGG